MKKDIEIDQQIELAAEEWVRLCIQLLKHRDKQKNGDKNGKSK